MTKNTVSTGSFRLVVVVGKTEVPAHNGRVTRDAARSLQKSYRVVRPTAVTRVRKVTA